MENKRMKNLIKFALMFMLSFLVMTVAYTASTTSADASVRTTKQTVKKANKKVTKKAKATKRTKPLSTKEIVYSVAQEKYGWGKVQASYLNKIISRESGWNLHARNGIYYGLFQTTNVWDKSAKGQAKKGLSYIRARYGTPHGAWNHALRTGWY
jgi:hypothetical protein